MMMACSTGASAQIEAGSTGSLRGYRIDGELMAFKTTIRAIAQDASQTGLIGTGRGGGGRYAREGDATLALGELTGPGGKSIGTYRAVYRSTGPGVIDAAVEVNPTADVPLRGVFFAVTLRGTDYADGSVFLIEPTEAHASLPTTRPAGPNLHLRGAGRGVRVEAARRRIEIAFPSPQTVSVLDDRGQAGGDFEIRFPVSLGDLKAGQQIRSTFSIKATGEVDKSPVALALDPSRPGRTFDGIGGNFRIQSRSDAGHIGYNLENLRVAWSRVAMPLDEWQPDENADPLTAAAEGRMDDDVREAMEMARTLAGRKIPLMISVWSAPRWAMSGEKDKDGKEKLNPDKWDKVFRSIGDYLEHLKKHYGAEPVLFSFNESDIGINVLQSAQEHADTIKRLGAHFASRGLATKILLGDTGNPGATRFIEPALADAEAAKHIGGVSFHSWWSGTVEQYTRWAEAARRLNVPLFVGEGGTDPFSWRVRHVFLEPWYGLEEISQYVEICRVAQPLSILHWQLTADYSVLTGGRGDPLQPAQRFWNLKQLGMTAAGAAAVPVTCDKPGVTACAFVDRGTHVVHLVNNGAARKAVLSGLPAGARSLRVYVTDGQRGMQEIGRVPIQAGTAELALDSMSFTSVVTQNEEQADTPKS